MDRTQSWYITKMIYKLELFLIIYKKAHKYKIIQKIICQWFI